MWKILVIGLLVATTARADGQWGEAGAAAAPDALAPCVQTCETQTFTADPFTTTPAKWTNVVTTPAIGSGCAAEWDQPDGRIGTEGNTCLTNSIVLYNGLISPDSCVSFKLTTAVLGDPDVAIGLLARATDSTEYPAVGNIVAVFALPDGASGRTEVESPGVDPNPCSTFGPISASNHHIGACIRGSGAGTVLNLFNLGAAVPGTPPNTDGGGTWGTPECSFLPCVDPAGQAGACTPAGQYKWGVQFTHAAPGFAGELSQIDDFKTYSCQ